MNRLLFVIILLLLINIHLSAQKFARKTSWSEKFSYTGKVDERNWNYFKGKFASEEEFYTDSIGNVFIKGGVLHIVATKDPREGKLCSSGRINTKGKKSFLYGKLELRAKVPMGKSIFPGIWMLREDHGSIFPLGEIDTMEYIDCFGGRQYCTTTHIVEKEPNQKEIRHRHYTIVNADMSKYHIYGFEWTPTCLRFLLDRKEVYKLPKKDAEFWPFDDPYVLILNVAYGSWGAKCGMDDSIFPCEMLIDWIRYYPLLENKLH